MQLAYSLAQEATGSLTVDRTVFLLNENGYPSVLGMGYLR